MQQQGWPKGRGWPEDGCGGHGRGQATRRVFSARNLSQSTSTTALLLLIETVHIGIMSSQDPTSLPLDEPEEGSDPIWTSSRTAKLIWRLGKVEEVSSETISNWSTSLSLSLSGYRPSSWFCGSIDIARYCIRTTPCHTSVQQMVSFGLLTGVAVAVAAAFDARLDAATQRELLRVYIVKGKVSCRMYFCVQATAAKVYCY